MTEKISAPWTDEQVTNLNAYQQGDVWHPFTCGNDSRHRDLVATRDGWICPDCDYTQNWAHGFMADAEQLSRVKNKIAAFKASMEND
jgi:hypothetical protein